MLYDFKDLIGDLKKGILLQWDSRRGMNMKSPFDRRRAELTAATFHTHVANRKQVGYGEKIENRSK